MNEGWHCANCGAPLLEGEAIVNSASGEFNGDFFEMGDHFYMHSRCAGEPPISNEDLDFLIWILTDPAPHYGVEKGTEVAKRLKKFKESYEKPLGLDE
jgi:hypothetical protein